MTLGNAMTDKLHGDVDYDAVVVGAGFAGLYALHRLRNEAGLKTKLYDKADGVGGTWQWNRYPGALSDSESFVYCYNFDKGLTDEWTWRNRYLSQPEVLAYLNHVADRFDLRRDIQLQTEVQRMDFDETHKIWTLRNSSGETVTTKYLVCGLGPLTEPNFPDIPNIEQFEGEIWHTSRWQDHYDVTGKRIGVIGTGSTGVQVITAIAHQVASLHVLQRTPQYCVPLGNRPMTPAEVGEIKSRYDRIWDELYKSVVAFGFQESTVAATSVTAEEREHVFEAAWQRGNGFHFMFGTFNDIAADPVANEAAADFIRRKIRTIVKDKATAAKLTPWDYYARRPLADSGYYEVFNQPQVSLHDVKTNPIARFAPGGLLLNDGTEVDCDVVIAATGFDALEGAYKQVDIRGRDGETLAEHWRDSSTALHGLMAPGFPNMFTVFGPNSCFANNPPMIAKQVEWVTDLIVHAEQQNSPTIEAKPEADQAWRDECEAIAHSTLFPRVNSWIFGHNIPDKAHTTRFYMGGLAGYLGRLREESESGYPSYTFETEKVGDVVSA